MPTPAATAAHFTNLYTFKGYPDGNDPAGAPIIDASGTLYGTTYSGGAYYDTGTVYKISNGTEVILHSFAGSYSDGANPLGRLLIDRHGNLYGVTESGGSIGSGTVFKLSPNGAETILHSFGHSSDGSYPSGSPIRDGAGNLYGMTWNGGNASDQGVVFRVDPKGNEKILYAFCQLAHCRDGAAPRGELMIDSHGNLYGTAAYGGTSDGCSNGCGVVFKLDPNGVETVLYSFQGGSDGYHPTAGVVPDSAGNLYGTTVYGGYGGCGTEGCGTAYKLMPDGSESVLYVFTERSDGGFPGTKLVLNKGGLYGTAPGSTVNGGTIFKLTTAGAFKVLYSFCSQPNCTDGDLPVALFHRGSSFYGTTAGDGYSTFGSVFQITL